MEPFHNPSKYSTNRKAVACLAVVSVARGTKMKLGDLASHMSQVNLMLCSPFVSSPSVPRPRPRSSPCGVCFAPTSASTRRDTTILASPTWETRDKLVRRDCTRAVRLGRPSRETERRRDRKEFPYILTRELFWEKTGSMFKKPTNIFGVSHQKRWTGRSHGSHGQSSETLSSPFGIRKNRPPSLVTRLLCAQRTLPARTARPLSPRSLT